MGQNEIEFFLFSSVVPHVENLNNLKVTLEILDQGPMTRKQTGMKQAVWQGTWSHYRGIAHWVVI